MYYTNIGPRSGPILCRHGFHAPGVLRARDDHAPIGLALPVGRDDDPVELWRLTVHGVELPGRFIVVDREFQPAQEEARSSRSRGGQSPLTSSSHTSA
jgi:hypothetical protein